jgi:hypothetical protein
VHAGRRCLAKLHENQTLVVHVDLLTQYVLMVDRFSLEVIANFLLSRWQFSQSLNMLSTNVVRLPQLFNLRLLNLPQIRVDRNAHSKLLRPYSFDRSSCISPFSGHPLKHETSGLF